MAPEYTLRGTWSLKRNSLELHPVTNSFSSHCVALDLEMEASSKIKVFLVWFVIALVQFELMESVELFVYTSYVVSAG